MVAIEFDEQEASRVLVELWQLRQADLLGH